MSKCYFRVHLGIALVGKMVHNQAHKSEGRKRTIMGKVKEMPYEEKYHMVIDNLKYHETSIQPLVGKLFGGQVAVELQSMSQEGIKPIPQGASFEEKYEIAYGNWVWSGKSVYRIIREKMGEEDNKNLR
jgi:hypothetical protein